jgi:hypothetical protein
VQANKATLRIRRRSIGRDFVAIMGSHNSCQFERF